MKFRCVGLLVVALVFGLAAIASADIIESIGLTYNTTYIDGDLDETSIPFTSVQQLDGSYRLTAPWNPSYVGYVSAFNVIATVTGLSSSQDVESMGARYLKTGAMTNDDLGYEGAISGYIGDTTRSDDPPSMGPTGNKSNAPPGSVYFVNFMNTMALGVNILSGGTGTTGNGTYGDYMADWQLGETGGKAASVAGNVIGQLYLTATGPGTFSWAFDPNPGKFQIINNNALGMGTIADDTVAAGGYPTYTGKGDSVEFTSVVPEPSTLALLGCGLFGLLAYAWRKRK